MGGGGIGSTGISFGKDEGHTPLLNQSSGRKSAFLKDCSGRSGEGYRGKPEGARPVRRLKQLPK